MPRLRMPSNLNGNALQALLGVVLASIGVACQFGMWYGAIVAGGMLTGLAVLARDVN